MPTDDAGSQPGSHDKDEFDSASWLWAATYLSLGNDQDTFQQLLEARLSVGKWEAAARELGLTNHHIQQCRVIDAVLDLAEQGAARLSVQTGLGVDRLTAILTSTACPPPPVTSDPVRQLELIKEHGLTFIPSFEDMVEFLPMERVLELLESSARYRLQKTLVHIEGLNSAHWPFYSIDELERLLTEFIAYLERNKLHIVRTGFPEVSFERSPWFEGILGTTYYVKWPEKTEKKQAATADKPAEDAALAYVYDYGWYPEGANAHENTSEAQDGYDVASILPGLVETDARRLDRMRSKFFDLKLKVLNVLLQELSASSKTPSEQCLRLLTDSLTPAEVQFCLRMDGFYAGHNVAGGGSGTGQVALAPPGGLHNLLRVIWHVEEELSIGMFSRTRAHLGALVQADSIGRPVLGEREYLATIDKPQQKVIDDALDAMAQLNERVITGWQEFHSRVSDQLSINYGEQTELADAESLKAIESGLRNVESQLGALPTKIAVAVHEELQIAVTEEEPLENVFRKEGASWLVVYQGKGEKDRVGHTLGMYHIRDLVSRPGEELWCTELDSLLPERQASMARRDVPKMTLDEAEEEGLSQDGGGDVEGTIDWTTKKDLKRRHEGLVRDVQEARDSGDFPEAIAKEQAAEKIAEYLSANTDRRGHPRKEADTTEKTRKAVYNRLTVAYKHIQDTGHIELSLHLRNAIRTGKTCFYVPEPPIDWVTT